MKTTNKKEKTFDTVKVFREIKEKIAKETEKMTYTEFKEYLNKNKLQTAEIDFAYAQHKYPAGRADVGIFGCSRLSVTVPATSKATAKVLIFPGFRFCIFK